MDKTINKIYVLAITCVLISQVKTKTANESQRQTEKKTVLVFGGNGFIGAATVQELLRVNYSVVIINRGNWYWDSAHTVRPYVKHIKCDRMQSLQRCSGLQHFLWSIDIPPVFEAVVDFSAYHVFEITEALNILKGKILKYIYISSDSVYEVCNKPHEGTTSEEDAVRPRDPDERLTFQRRDDYGHRKLQCEEELQHQSSDKDGVPYISLRLPDVIGSRDNTYRWWIYQLWIKLSEYLDRKLSVPKVFWNRRMSMVYVNDVAKLIPKLIASDVEIYNNAFNLAMAEMPTLVQLLHGIMDALNVDDINIVEDPDDEGFRLFPSVKSGPLNVTKAVTLLNWIPTPWQDVLEDTVQFYEDAILTTKFEVARKDVIRTLQQNFSKDPVRVIKGIEEKYKIKFLKDVTHDEL